MLILQFSLVVFAVMCFGFTQVNSHIIVAFLFLLTGQSPRVKAFLCPLPMLAVCCDIASWWLARPFEPLVYVIGAAGAVFGTTMGIQILCILGALWLGRPRETPGRS